MGAGIAAGPHCRRCWHTGFPAPELTASFRRSLPFGAPTFRNRVLPVCPAFPARPLGGLAVPDRAPGTAASAVPDRMGLAVAGAVAAHPALPRSGCCWRVSFSGPSGTAPSGSSLAGLAFGRIPQGEKGPFRASRRAAPGLAWRWVRPPVLRPSALPRQPCCGTPFRHPEPVLPACIPPLPKRASARRKWFHCKLSVPIRSENFNL
jgi:hypothetical protein